MNDMSLNENHSKRPDTRKRLFFFLKIALALAILLSILATVKVNDHLKLPEGTTYAGIHTGTFDYPEGCEKPEYQVQFRKKKFIFLSIPKEEFYFEATVGPEGVLNAAVRGSEGHVHAIPSEDLGAIELREGLISVLRKIDPEYWLLSMAVYFLAIGITAFRWGYLLKATNLSQTFFRAYRLTYIGVFFNNIVPGQTGGDLVRAYYLAKENKDKRTDSIISVLVDRGLGITALACIGAVVIPFDFETFAPAATVIYGFIGIVGLGCLIYFSKRLRRAFKFNLILKKLPFRDLFQKIDRSIFLYRYRKSSILICFLISFVVHLTIILAVWILGKGLSIHLPLTTYLAFIPIIFIVSSLPLTPSGWGVGEVMFVLFFHTYGGVAAAPALALSLVFRANATIQSLLGGIFLLTGKERGRPGTMEELAQDPQPPHSDEPSR
ncbi:MAG: flippase-like domain-containing protein [Planctomycetes bacterium]|nr:flippase-like domain-containing protein [Planctomycetota bacterium]